MRALIGLSAIADVSDVEAAASPADTGKLIQTSRTLDAYWHWLDLFM